MHKYSIGIFAGFGDGLRQIDGRRAPDGRQVKIDHYFLKAYNAVIKYQLENKVSVGLDVGMVNDYSSGYLLESKNPKSGFGVSSYYALPNRYVLWHFVVNVYQQLYSFRRFGLEGYMGAGLHLFVSDNYPKDEALDFYFPGDENKYYVLPSSANKRPIAMLNAGLNLNYKLSKRSVITFQPSLRLGFKNFLIDRVRIETPDYNHEVTTRMNGSNALLSLGYSFRF